MPFVLFVGKDVTRAVVVRIDGVQELGQLQLEVARMTQLLLVLATMAAEPQVKSHQPERWSAQLAQTAPFPLVHQQLEEKEGQCQKTMSCESL